MKLNAIIIDDEQDSATLLKEKISRWQPNIIIDSVCHNVKDGLLNIVRHKPDLLFLDIYMPGMNGLEFFGYLKSLLLPLQCIIVTAHAEPEYFREAIKLGLTDYLLKPVIEDELASAISNVQKRIATGMHKTLLSKLTNAISVEQLLKLPIVNGLIRIGTTDIIYATSNAKFTNLMLNNGKTELITCGISELEKQTSGSLLHRIDRFTLLNVRYVRKVSTRLNKVYFKTETGETELAISNRGKDTLLKMLKEY